MNIFKLAMRKTDKTLDFVKGELVEVIDAVSLQMTKHDLSEVSFAGLTLKKRKEATNARKTQEKEKR